MQVCTRTIVQIAPYIRAMAPARHTSMAWVKILFRKYTLNALQEHRLELKLAVSYLSTIISKRETICQGTEMIV